MTNKPLTTEDVEAFLEKECAALREKQEALGLPAPTNLEELQQTIQEIKEIEDAMDAEAWAAFNASGDGKDPT